MARDSASVTVRAQMAMSAPRRASSKVVAAPMEKLCDSCCQIYLNTTSLGMHPNVDASAFGDVPPKLSVNMPSASPSRCSSAAPRSRIS